MKEKRGREEFIYEKVEEERGGLLLRQRTACYELKQDERSSR